MDLLCEYGHELAPGKFEPITITITDEAGNPIADEDGEVMKTTLRLPVHRVRYPGNERDPDGVDPRGEPRPSRWEADPRGAVTSAFDPLGLVAVLCDHGLQEHPAGRPMYPRAGRSWVRSRYATYDFFCVVDRGETRPDDLTTPLA